MPRGRQRGVHGRRRRRSATVAIAAIAFAVQSLVEVTTLVAAAEPTPMASMSSKPQPQTQPQPPASQSPPSKNNVNVARGNRSVTVTDAAGLRAALEDEDVADVLIGGSGGGGASPLPSSPSPSSLPTAATTTTSSGGGGGDIDLEGQPSWPRQGPPVVLSAGRTLVLRSADRSKPSSLNFSGGPTPAIVVSKNATLVLSQLLVTAAKPPPAAEAGNPGKGIAGS